MSAPSSVSTPAFPCSAQLMWSLPVSGAVRGLSLAREGGWCLVRDENHWLYLLNQAGDRQAQLRAPHELTASACADDNSAFAVGGKNGDLWWLAPDLMPRWQRNLGQRVEAVAVDALGQYVAVADAGGGLSLLTRRGQPVWRVQTPRALRFLAFLAEAPLLVGSADFGLVGCYDACGRQVWRDGPVAHAGSLAASGDGAIVVLACFTDGLCRYGPKGPPPVRQPMPDPCRLAALSYDGRTVLTTGFSGNVLLLDDRARVRGEEHLETAATALALSALGDRALVGVAGGVRCLKWR